MTSGLGVLRARSRSVFRPPAVASMGFVLILVLLPLLVNFYYVQRVQTMALYVLVALGLAVAVEYAGLLSIGHAALMATGAYVAAYLAAVAGWPFLAATAVAVLATMLLGALLAIPSGRLTHFYFAMVTLGLALVTPQLLLQWSDVTGGYSGIAGIPVPAVFGLPIGRVTFYYVVLGSVAVVALALRSLLSRRWGRGFLLVRDDEIAAASLGINPYTTKVRAFVLSAAPAGLAGVYAAYANRVVTPDQFNSQLALFFLLAVVLGGRSLFGAIGAVILLFALPELLRDYRSYTDVLFGVVLLVVLAVAPRGLPSAMRTLTDRVRRRVAREMPTVAPASSTLATVPGSVRGGTDVLRIQGLEKRFGGLQVLRGLDLSIAPGEVVAIIGPNGSGKTTLLNLVSGFYRPSGGSVQFGGRPLPARPSSVARMGIGRTFQTPKVVAEETALNNVMAGAAASGRSSMLEDAFAIGRAPAEEEAVRERALELLGCVGLADRAQEPAGNLPHPHQRFLEIARALMRSPHILLLDEPAAGLSADELERLYRLVTALAGRGLGIGVVEHNMDLVMSIASRVVVLDSGRVVAEGTPAVVQALPEVAEIYLGRPVRVDATSPVEPVA